MSYWELFRRHTAATCEWPIVMAACSGGAMNTAAIGSPSRKGEASEVFPHPEVLNLTSACSLLRGERLHQGRAMTRKTKGRDRWHGATPKTSDSRNHTVADPLAGWFNLAKPSRNRQQKREWLRGARR